jgi:predicted ATPase
LLIPENRKKKAMRISVEDFKGITKVEDFRLDPISVLAGINSGGKSSLVQFIMLLKQSLEARSPEAPLKLNKPYVSLGRFESLTRRASAVKSFRTTITLEHADIDPKVHEIFSGRRRMPGFDSTYAQDIAEIRVRAEFRKPTSKVVVSACEIELVGTKTFQLQITRKSHGKSHTIKTNADRLFFRRIRFRQPGLASDETPIANRQSRTYDGKVGYAAFFPIELDIEPSDDEYVAFSPIITYIRNSLYSAFERISYIGPLREEPREFYYHDDDLIDHIGNKGENAAFLLSKHADDSVEYAKFSPTDADPGNIELRRGTLRQGVNYWLCDVFDLAREVRVDRAKTNRYLYSVTLKNRDGSIVPITHVGFGVSQIFPILVEGLRAAQSGRRIIILEQPEIHLHPRVQSLLFDFIRTVPNASFLIETHSDHFINRLRRRVAEDQSGQLVKSINLTFVNAAPTGTIYERLELEESGALSVWPVGFFDQYEDDVRAIVRAQAAKRRKSKGQVDAR